MIYSPGYHGRNGGVAMDRGGASGASGGIGVKRALSKIGGYALQSTNSNEANDKDKKKSKSSAPPPAKTTKEIANSSVKPVIKVLGLVLNNILDSEVKAELTKLFNADKDNECRSAKYKNHASAVHLAAKNGNAAMVDVLLTCGVFPGLRTDRKRTDKNILHVAFDEEAATPGVVVTDSDREAVLKTILRHKETQAVLKDMINSIDKDACATPFHLAVEFGYSTVVQLMIEKGADVTRKDKNGRTVLHLAAGLPNHDVFKKVHTLFTSNEVVQSSRSLDAKLNPLYDTWGRTPMHYACLTGSYENAKELLLQSESSATERDIDGMTPLMLLCEAVEEHQGHLKVIGLLLSTERIADNKPLRVKYLKEDMKLFMKNIQSSSVEDEIYDFIPLLLATNNEKMTAFHIVAKTDNIQICEKLLSFAHIYQADLDAIDAKGETALHKAVKRDPRTNYVNDFTGPRDIFALPLSRPHNLKVEMVRTLVNKDNKSACSVNAVNSDYAGVGGQNGDLKEELIGEAQREETPMHMVCAMHGWESLNVSVKYRATLEDKALGIVKILAQPEHEVMRFEKQDSMGRTCLHNAAAKGLLDVVKLLVDPSHGKPSLFDIKDSNGRIAAFDAIENGHYEVMAYFFEEFGGRLDMRWEPVDNDGNSLLFVACANNLAEMASYLFAKGGNPLLPNAEGWTPIVIAAKNQLHDIVDLFYKYRDGLHPFQPVAQPLKGEITEAIKQKADVPLVLAMASAQVSPVVIENSLSKFIRKEQPTYEGIEFYYDYGISPSGFEFLLSPEGRNALLAVFGSRNKAILSARPVVALMDILWEKYGQGKFVTNLVIYSVLLFSMTLLCIFVGSGNGSMWYAITLRVLLGFYAIGADAFFMIGEFKEFFNTMHRINYILDVWNWVAWISYLLILFAIPYIWYPSIPGERDLFAVLILIMWIRFLEYAAAFRSTSTYVRVLLQMTFSLAQYLALLSVLLVGFGLGFFILLGTHHADGYTTIVETVITLWRNILGDTDYHTVQEHGDWVVILFYVFFTIVGPVLMLNLLIAIMTTSYESIREDADLEFLVARGEVLFKVLPRDKDMKAKAVTVTAKMQSCIGAVDPDRITGEIVPACYEFVVEKAHREDNDDESSAGKSEESEKSEKSGKSSKSNESDSPEQEDGENSETKPLVQNKSKSKDAVVKMEKPPPHTGNIHSLRFRIEYPLLNLMLGKLFNNDKKDHEPISADYGVISERRGNVDWCVKSLVPESGFMDERQPLKKLKDNIYSDVRKVMRDLQEKQERLLTEMHHKVDVKITHKVEDMNVALDRLSKRFIKGPSLGKKRSKETKGSKKK